MKTKITDLLFVTTIIPRSIEQCFRQLHIPILTAVTGEAIIWNTRTIIPYQFVMEQFLCLASLANYITTPPSFTHGRYC